MMNLKAQPGFNLHHAIDGEVNTVFKSMEPLALDQALVVDLAMIFVIAKVELLEEDAHGCVHCVLEFSCDQREWFQVHAFEAGANELVEWAVGRAGDDETLDEMGFLVQAQRPMPRLARYVRIRAIEAAEAPILDAGGESNPPSHWHVKELNVFGEELSSSISADAPVWLDIVMDGDGGDDSAAIEPLVAQADHTVSHATDADLNTAFISMTTPKEGHVLIIDLQDVHRLALIELYQPRQHGVPKHLAPGLASCTLCLVWKSVGMRAQAAACIVCSREPSTSRVGPGKHLRPCKVRPAIACSRLSHPTKTTKGSS